MSVNDQLRVYLNDHLAGANAGVEMARKLQSEVAGEPDEALLGPVGDEIAQDVETLRELMEHLGVTRNPVKQAAGWVAEKAQRAGVAAHAVTHGPELARMLAAESLSLGVEGKLGLWLALTDMVPSYPALADFDLATLIARARDQRGRIEAVRRAAGLRAFTGS